MTDWHGAPAVTAWDWSITLRPACQSLERGVPGHWGTRNTLGFLEGENVIRRACAAVALAASCSFAHATTITFDVFALPETYLIVSMGIDGYDFTGTGCGGDNCLGLWGTSEPASIDPGGVAVFVDKSFATTVLTSPFFGTFNFNSIDLADVHNAGVASTIRFDFTYAAGGGTSSRSVTLDDQIGSQTFVFNESGLSSVSWVTTAGDNGKSQFDNVDVSVVPEPATLVMLLAGLGVVGSATRRRHD